MDNDTSKVEFGSGFGLVSEVFILTIKYKWYFLSGRNTINDFISALKLTVALLLALILHIIDNDFYIFSIVFLDYLVLYLEQVFHSFHSSPGPHGRRHKTFYKWKTKQQNKKGWCVYFMESNSVHTFKWDLGRLQRDLGHIASCVLAYGTKNFMAYSKLQKDIREEQLWNQRTGTVFPSKVKLKLLILLLEYAYTFLLS